MAGFFKKIAKRFTGEARAERKAKRHEFKLRKKGLKYQSLADRDRIAEDGMSQRAAIAPDERGWTMAGGFADEREANSKGGFGANLLSAGKDLLSNFLGGGKSTDEIPAPAPKKDNTMLYVLGALGVGIAVIFGLKKKK